MSYEEKFALVRESLTQHFKELIVRNHTKNFTMWLKMEANMEFGYGYQNKFKEHFGEKINDEIKDQLWFAGQNIIYAINSFIYMEYLKEGEEDNYNLAELLVFVDFFISSQLNDFGNDYDTSELDDDDNEVRPLPV